MLDNVVITVEGARAVISVVIHVGVGTGATHSYAWISDPIPGAPHLVEQ